MSAFTNAIEDILFTGGVPAFCAEADVGIAEEGVQGEAGDGFELMIPKFPRASVMGLLKKNKKTIDGVFGSGKYFLKVRSFHYYFSYIHFKNYEHKDGIKSFLSISSSEVDLDGGRLGIELKIIVIGMPDYEVREAVELYIYERISDFNSDSRLVEVVRCFVGFKVDAFTLFGEADPELYELPLEPLMFDFRYEDDD